MRRESKNFYDYSVYMKQENEKSMMEFVLPSKFSLENVSQPLSNQVEIYKDKGRSIRIGSLFWLFQQLKK